MKKFLLIATLAANTAVCGYAIDGQWQWTKCLNAGNNVMSNVENVIAAPDGDYYMVGQFSKPATDTDITWGETTIAAQNTVLTAYQKDFIVGRIDNQGDLRWSVTPTLSNVSANSLYLAQTADGGVVLSCNATFNSNAAGDAPSLITLTDTANNALTITNDNDTNSKSPYVGVLIKFSADGAVEWHKEIYSNPFGDADKTIFDANASTLTDVTADEVGNVYVAGYYKTSVDFGGTTITAKNGKVSTKIEDQGDAFIAKYDSEGNFVTVLTNNAESAYASKEASTHITYNNGKLYCGSVVNALDGATYTYFGQAADINSKSNIVYGVVDCATMTCESAGALKATGTANNAQLQNIVAYDGEFYLCGSLNGGFAQGETTLGTSQAAKLENMVARVKTNDLSATLYLSKKNIGNDFYAIEAADDNKLYTYGYVLGDATTYLFSYDLTTGELLDSTALWKGTSTVLSACFNNETHQLVGTTYSKQLKNFIGDETEATTDAYSAFHGFLTAVQLPTLSASTSIENVAVADTDTNAPVEYFNLQGVRIANPAAGQLVIRRQGNKAEKLIVR